MPNFYSRLNLASAIFPFYTEAAGRTIMVPQLDENWDRYNAANTVQDKGVPQVFYMHNVLPLAGGFQSIGYILTLPGAPNASNFDTAFLLYDINDNAFIFVPAGGQNYIFDGSVGSWASFPFPSGVVTEGTIVTCAYVQGQSYIYYANVGCYIYTPGAVPTFTPQVLTGLTVANVRAICEANGYMIACTATAVAWSSLTQPTNFVPSIDTGAGGGSVQDVKGKINFVLGVPGGFLIYCENNVVGASYTANTSFPYQILESQGSGGVVSPDYVAYQSTFPYHVALTSGGIMQIGLTSSQPTLPEVSDFLTAQIFEDFDEEAIEFSYQYLSGLLYIKMAAISARFIIISYGVQPGQFTHAIVYDVVLNRYGRIKTNHVCAFTYQDPEPEGLLTYDNLMNTPIGSISPTTTYGNFFAQINTTSLPKKNVAFMASDGTVNLIDFEIGEDSADGVFIIGKFQMQRDEMIVHQWTDIETVNINSNFAMYVLPTFDGKDFKPAVATVANNSQELMRTYAKRTTGKNISLALIGAFNATTLVLNFTVGGFR